MAKVTSKLQLTVPKAIASQYGIPGDSVELIAAGEAIRIVPAKRRARSIGLQECLRIFDGIMKRVDRRAGKPNATSRASAFDSPAKSARREESRGWTREDLYDGRGLPL
jgi:bifunctional DNA-binding transcriptional regulator/antitoxin component of YhaV-PrlF toxin-antitoxin module